MHVRALLLQAETRAEFAERSVAKLEKTIDDLEGWFLTHTSSLSSALTSEHSRGGLKATGSPPYPPRIP